MKSNNVIILHPRDKNRTILENIFKERGDNVKFYASWNELEEPDLYSADLLILDVSFVNDLQDDLFDFLSQKKILFTNSESIKITAEPNFFGNHFNEVINPPYNRLIIEQLIVRG